MQTLLGTLMANYRQDILDLEDLLHQLEELEGLLSQENAKTPSQKRNEFFTFFAQQQKEAAQKMGEKAGPDLSYVLMEQELNGFSEKRHQRLVLLQQRGAESAKLRERIGQVLGVRDFSLQSLQGFLSGNEFAELDELSKRLKETMTKMLEQDQKVMKLLKMEIGSVKLELHRMQAGTQSKKVYQNQAGSEARFIDKMK